MRLFCRARRSIPELQILHKSEFSVFLGALALTKKWEGIISFNEDVNRKEVRNFFKSILDEMEEINTDEMSS